MHTFSCRTSQDHEKSAQQVVPIRLINAKYPRYPSQPDRKCEDARRGEQLGARNVTESTDETDTRIASNITPRIAITSLQPEYTPYGLPSGRVTATANDHDEQTYLSQQSCVLLHPNAGKDAPTLLGPLSMLKYAC